MYETMRPSRSSHTFAQDKEVFYATKPTTPINKELDAEEGMFTELRTKASRNANFTSSQKKQGYKIVSSNGGRYPVNRVSRPPQPHGEKVVVLDNGNYVVDERLSSQRHGRRNSAPLRVEEFTNSLRAKEFVVDHEESLRLKEPKMSVQSAAFERGYASASQAGIRRHGARYASAGDQVVRTRTFVQDLDGQQREIFADG